MIPLGAMKFVVVAAVFGFSLFFSIRMLFAPDYVREEWRYSFKRFSRVPYPKFKRYLRILAGLLLVVCLLSGYTLLQLFLED